MTERKFWKQLTQLSYHGKEQILDVIRVLREAYRNDLGVMCAVRHTGPDMVNQLYVNLDEANPAHAGNRYMLCYTNMQMALNDNTTPEPPEKLPLRFVVDNALNKPVIGGLVFNRHVRDRTLIVPKQFLGNKSFEVYKRIFSNHPDPFMLNDED